MAVSGFGNHLQNEILDYVSFLRHHLYFPSYSSPAKKDGMELLANRPRVLTLQRPSLSMTNLCKSALGHLPGIHLFSTKFSRFRPLNIMNPKLSIRDARILPFPCFDFFKLFPLAIVDMAVDPSSFLGRHLPHSNATR